MLVYMLKKYLIEHLGMSSEENVDRGMLMSAVVITFKVQSSLHSTPVYFLSVIGALFQIV